MKQIADIAERHGFSEEEFAYLLANHIKLLLMTKKSIKNTPLESLPNEWERKKLAALLEEIKKVAT